MRSDMVRNATTQIATIAKWSLLCGKIQLAVCLSLVTFITGCGSGQRSIYRAGGKVTFANGAPLTHGWVSFRQVEGEPKMTARGEIQPDGSFQLTTYDAGDGAILGRHQALVVAPIAQNTRWGPANVAPPAPEIHERFENFESSKLEFVVTKDTAKNQFNIVVTK